MRPLSGFKYFSPSVACALLLSSCSHEDASFSNEAMNRLPEENWITNGGSFNNQRYSPLDEINVNNIINLKGKWLTHLGGSGVSAKYSAESQPLEYDGVIYVSTGEDDVFAVSVSDGKILWKYESGIDQTISTICCGWLNRGVALGPGKVFIGQLDGKLVALDQKTGKVAWVVQPVKWQDGYTLTAAPLYVDGKVIIGTAGGEYGIRGQMMAFDAKTGKELWRFYTVPGPGEAGHETWPQNSDVWKRGGGAVWQTPSVDTDLGLIYFSTGNAGPDFDGSSRAGDNLYTSSIVALDLKTGKLRWHYQLVHHDLWDYDAPSPTILFDTMVNGKPVKAIAEAAKTGWVYLLDRTSGKPLYPITETPVPQEPRQKTAATQPIPSWPALSPHVPTADQVAKIERDAGIKGIAAAKSIFTPFWKNMVVVAPGPAGGANWPPSSYDPKNNLMFICGQKSVAGLTSETEDRPDRGSDRATSLYIGSTAALGNGYHSAGWFAAFDPGTQKVVWKKDFPSSCYSGSAVTAGNLVFVGRNTGELQAYEATTGRLVWRFQTGAGANNVPTIFRYRGKQYIAFYAGGNALAGTAHGDNLWLFSLDGKVGEVQVGKGGQSILHAGEKAAGPVPGLKGDASRGKHVFADNCSACHGMNGLGGNGGPNLGTMVSAKNSATVLNQVTNGGRMMPRFKGVISDQSIADVSAYVVKDIAHGK